MTTDVSPIAESVGIPQAFPAAYKAMLQVERAMDRSALDRRTYELVRLRASQINGCAYCLDMHSKDARVMGETEARIYLLNAWREAPHYTRRERAALGLTEAITLVSHGPVSPRVEVEARQVFDADEYAALVFAIVTINAWNRLTIANHTAVGDYQPRSSHGR
jgi:AhpD family alkylhydroperoxidase